MSAQHPNGEAAVLARLRRTAQLLLPRRCPELAALLQVLTLLLLLLPEVQSSIV